MKLIPKLIFAGLIFFSLILFIGYFRFHIFNAREVRGAQNFLSKTIESDKPSTRWLKSYDGSYGIDGTECFYFFKTYFASKGVKAFDLKTSFCNGVSNNEYFASLYLSYGKERPVILVRIREDNKQLKFFPSFNLNNCLFSGDYNQDGIINIEDVELAEVEYRKSNL